MRVVVGGGFVRTEGFLGTGGFLTEERVTLSGVGGIGEFIMTESCCSWGCIWDTAGDIVRGGGGKGSGFLSRVCVDALVVFSVD